MEYSNVAATSFLFASYCRLLAVSYLLLDSLEQPARGILILSTLLQDENDLS